MDWSIQPVTVNGLIEVKVTGVVKAGPLKVMTRDLRDAVLKKNCRQVLLDYTQATSGLEPYEVFERPKVLQEVGFPANVKVAILYAVLDENTQFLENVYRNKSFAVKVFADRLLALQWLGEPQGVAG